MMLRLLRSRESIEPSSHPFQQATPHEAEEILARISLALDVPGAHHPGGRYDFEQLIKGSGWVGVLQFVYSFSQLQTICN